MKIAVMADIHSNAEAFRACLNKAKHEHVDEFIFLGDYLGDMANPQDTMNLICEINTKYHCTFIKGNKEDYWLNHRDNPDEIWEYGKTTTGMLKYNYDRLTDADFDFFEGMPISKVMEYKGLPPFVVCHGSPFKTNQSMREDYEYIDSLVSLIDSDLIICAHFHIQSEYTKGNKTVINPGSVGVPLEAEGNHISQFMILEDKNGKWTHTFIDVPYNLEKTLSEMDEERLYELAPGWYKMTKHLLLTGKTSHATIIKRVMDKYHKDTGLWALNEIPEAYWTEEVANL